MAKIFCSVCGVVLALGVTLELEKEFVDTASRHQVCWTSKLAALRGTASLQVLRREPEGGHDGPREICGVHCDASLSCLFSPNMPAGLGRPKTLPLL